MSTRQSSKGGGGAEAAVQEPWLHADQAWHVVMRQPDFHPMVTERRLWPLKSTTRKVYVAGY